MYYFKSQIREKYNLKENNKGTKKLKWDKQKIQNKMVLFCVRQVNLVDEAIEYRMLWENIIYLTSISVIINKNPCVCLCASNLGGTEEVFLREVMFKRRPEEKPRFI